MTSLTSDQLIAHVAPQLGELGSKFMLDKKTMERATELGFAHPFAFYFLGRGGVLGDVDADVIVAAFAFFEPSMVRKMWDLARSTTDPRTAVDEYAKVCANYGRDHLTGAPGLERFNELTGKVLPAIDVTGLSLFAGWRAVTLPNDEPARAYHNIHLLREWRGSAHICAVATSALTAEQAIVTGATTAEAGVATAKAFGWSGDCGDLTGLDQIRRSVEATTSEMQRNAFEQLSASERGEFSELVSGIKAFHDKGQ